MDVIGINEKEWFEKAGLLRELQRRKFESMIECKGRILEIGCGVGRLSKKYNNIVGIDIVPRQNVSVVASAVNLPFKKSVFNQVLMEHIIEHLDLKDQEKSVAEVFRVLYSGGKVIIATPNRSLYNLFIKIRLLDWSWTKCKEHKNEFNRKELVSLLKKFEVRINVYNLIDLIGVGVKRV